MASSVLRRDRLVGPGLQTQDVLRSQPGVAVTESGGFGAPATAAIRGATAADTPVYLAGVRLNDDVGGTADLSLVPLWLIDRVEIYRGHAPLEADRFAPGGAIFLEPRRPTKNMGGVGYYGGSWGTSKGWAYEGIRSGPLSGLVGVSADQATNRYPFVNDHGMLFAPNAATADRRQNGDERTLEGWGLARVELGKGATLDILANGISREQGVPSLALLQTRRARAQSTRTLASIGIRAPFDSDERCVFESRTSVLLGRAVYDDPLGELTLNTHSLSILGRRVEQSLGVSLHVTDSLRLHPMVNLAHERIQRNPDDIPLGQAHRTFARVGMSAEERATDWLTLHALASGECHHTGADTDSLCDVVAPTGRVGVQVGSDRFRVLTNVGHYVRVPTLGEMYGVSGTMHGNRQLTPESGTSAELGIRAQTRRGTFFHGAYLDAFVFARWSEGLIAYERIAQGFVVPYNVGRARMVGAELLTGIAFTPILRAEVSATALDPRDTSLARTTVNDILPYRSRLIAAPRLLIDWKKANKNRDELSGIGGEARALYQSSRYADPAGLVIIDEQVSVDVEVHASWFNGLLTARARMADIFDAKRTDIIGYPLPGRSVYFGLEATW